MAARLEWGSAIGCGWQTSGPSAIWRLFGRSFNPPDIAWPGPCHISILGGTSTFCLANHWVGHEVMLNLHCVMVACGCNYSGYLEFCFFRGSSWIFFWDQYINLSSSSNGTWTCSWYSSWGYTGVKPFCAAEICCNGSDYCIKACLEGHGYKYHYFTVCCLQNCRLCKYPGSAAGSMWIQGTCLGISPTGCSNWPGYPCTWRSVILNDGSTHGWAGSGKEGAIWMEPSVGQRLYWVDCDGWIRRSKKGDFIGYRGYDGMPQTPGTSKSGYIWAQSGFQDDTIFYIDANGVKIRQGPGDLFADGY